jgi:hypothetical protein
MAKLPFDNARPTTTDPEETVAEKIALARKHLGGMKGSPEWAAAADVQTSATSWSDETDALEAIDGKIQRLLARLAAARRQEAVVVRDWRAAKLHVLASVNVRCAGSKDRVQGFGYDVALYEHQPPRGVPQGLHGKRSKKPGVATASWTTHRGEHNLFVVQYATDLADPTTYSAPISWTRGTYVLEGQTPGQTIYFRVAVVEPKLPLHQTAYTDWVPVMVSA